MVYDCWLDIPAKKSNTPDAQCALTTKTVYAGALSTAKKRIIDGDIFQVVLSRLYEVTTDQTPLELYTELRSVNPSPYMYLFEFNGTGIIGASPETLLSVHDRKVIIN